jgi:long-chain acyl-CoA synthetase
MLMQAKMERRGQPRNALGAIDSNSIDWLTWGQLAESVATMVKTLERFSLQNQAQVASKLTNSLAWISIDLACQILGHIHVAADVRWPAATTQRMLGETKCELVFTQRQDQLHPATQSVLARSCRGGYEKAVQLDATASSIDDDALDEMLQTARKVDPNSPAQILFTSGTTGMPKAVVLSHRNLVSNALAKLDAAPQSSLDLRLNILPFCHAYARTCELSTWILTGGQLCIATYWDDFLRLATRIKPTLVNLVPHWVNKLAEMAETSEKLREMLGGNLRLLQVGGAALSNQVWNRFADAGLPPLQGYGLTEASPVICSNRAGQQKPGTIGWPVYGVETKIDFNGQLWARGENIMLGYFDDRQATDLRIQDGWLSTGDLVEQDSEGRLRVTGRADNRIVLSTGLKVSPELIEARLMSSPDIEHVLVVGTNQPFLVALVWCKSTKTDREVVAESHSVELPTRLDAALDDLPDYMRPGSYIFIASKIESDMYNSKGQILRHQAIEAFHSIIEEAYRRSKRDVSLK